MEDPFTLKTAATRVNCGNSFENIPLVLFLGPTRDVLAVAYSCNMNIDVDGDPQAYGPFNKPDVLDNLWDAGFQSTEWNQAKKAAYDAGIASAKADYEALAKKKAQLPRTAPQADKDALQSQIDTALERILDLNPYEFKTDAAGRKLPNNGKIFWHWYGVVPLSTAEANGLSFMDPVTKSSKSPLLVNSPGANIPNPGIYEDVYGKFPVVQVAPEPGPGYFVSQLAPLDPDHPRNPQLRNPQFPNWDQRSTLAPNATQIEAYAALTHHLSKATDWKLKMRDKVFAIRLNTGDTLAFPFLDHGGWKLAVAECSATAFRDLGGEFAPVRPGVSPLYGAKNEWNQFPVLYLAFPNSADQQPSALLRRIATASNADDFSTILAFIAKATADAWNSPSSRVTRRINGRDIQIVHVGQDPVSEYNRWTKLPEDRRPHKPDVNDFADVIDVALRDNGFNP